MATFTPFDLTVDWTGLTTGATPYTAGDQYGAEKTLATVAGANNGYGVITGVSVFDDGDVVVAADLHIFSDSTTPAADNAAAAWSDADMVKLIAGGVVIFPALTDFGGIRAASVSNLWVPFRSGSGHDDLFLDLVCRGNHNQFAAADDLHVRVSGFQIT